MKNYLSFLFIFPIFLFSQENDTYKLDYKNTEKATQLCTKIKSNSFKSNDDADIALAKILSVVGASKRFVILPCENINNALATIDDNIRYILYDPEFLNSISNNSKYWGNMSILAHEVGHHINGHTLGITISDYEKRLQELEADEFSGFVMQKLGATLEQATETIAAFSPSGDDTYSTHPNKERRVISITKGYNNSLNNKFIKEEKLSDWEEYYYRGSEKFKAEDYDGAIIDFSESIKLQPSVNAYVNRGLSKEYINDYPGAMIDMQRAIEIDPKDWQPYYYLGIYLNEYKKDYFGSLSAFENYFNATPWVADYNDLEAQYYFSQSLYMKEFYDESFSSIDWLIKDYDLTTVLENDRIAKIYSLRGRNYYEKDSFALAMIDYEKTVELNPKYALYQELIGDFYLETKEYDKAIEYYNKAILIDQNKTTVYEYRAYAEEMKEDFYAALFDMNEAIKLDPENGHYYLKRGEYKLKINDKKGACADWLIGNKKGSEESLNKLIEKCGYKKEDFYTADDYYNMGLEENEKENYSSALKLFTKSKELGFLKLDLLNSHIVLSYFGSHEFEKSLKVLNAIPKNTEQINVDWISSMRIELKYNLKDFPEVIKESKEFIALKKINPDDINSEFNINYINDNLDRSYNIYYYYTHSLINSSDYDNSINVSNQFLKIGRTILSNDFISAAYYWLAEAKKAKGDNLGAMQDINEDIKLYPENPFYLMMRGEIKLALGSKKTACEDLNLALKYATEQKLEKEILDINRLIKENCE